MVAPGASGIVLFRVKGERWQAIVAGLAMRNQVGSF